MFQSIIFFFKEIVDASTSRQCHVLSRDDLNTEEMELLIQHVINRGENVSRAIFKERLDGSY